MSDPATTPDPNELSALAGLAADELAGAHGGLGGIHDAVAQRAFGLAGPEAKEAHAAHDAIAGAVYGALGGATRLLGRTVAHAVAHQPVALSTRPRGAAVLGALNGWLGDALEREGSPLDQVMAVRVAGHPVAAEPDVLAAAFPRATGHLVVFLHGLGETEHAWRRGGRAAYGEQLERDLGCTAVDIRFNTGRHISENGASLAELLEQLVGAWAVRVDRIALVGHSLGGLVARSACHQAVTADREWVRAVRHVVSLGSPHFGAPLAQGVHYAAHALEHLPETKPVAALLRRRSAGIRDLRHGSLVDEDWRGRDPDALIGAATAEVPLLPGATYCFVTATVTRSPRHPVGRLLGDMLVLQDSASGRSRTRRLDFQDEHGLALGATTHLALLNHPEVYAHLRRWIAQEAAERPPREGAGAGP